MKINTRIKHHIQVTYEKTCGKQIGIHYLTAARGFKFICQRIDDLWKKGNNITSKNTILRYI